MESIDDIQRELARLREENIRLKSLLQNHGIAFEVSQDAVEQVQKLMPQLSLEEKVALFRSLFRGREDVFARRWYSLWSSFPLQFSISVKKQRFQRLHRFFTMYLSQAYAFRHIGKCEIECM